MDKLRMKFLTLNVDFNGPSVDFLGSRKPAHESIKERYFTVVGQSFMKAVADRHGHAAYHNKHRDELFSRVNIDGFGRP